MPIAMLGGMEVALLVPGLLLALALGRAPVRQTLPWLLLFLDCGAVIIDSQRRKSCDPKLRFRTNQEALCISELAQGYPMSFESTDHDVVTVRITVCELSCSCGGVHFGLLLKCPDKRASSRQRFVEVIHTEEEP